jgi:hypothetical protein
MEVLEEGEKIVIWWMSRSCTELCVWKLQSVCPYGRCVACMSQSTWPQRWQEELTVSARHRAARSAPHLLPQAGVLSHIAPNLFLFTCVLETRFFKLTSGRALTGKCIWPRGHHSLLTLLPGRPEPKVFLILLFRMACIELLSSL